MTSAWLGSKARVTVAALSALLVMQAVLAEAQAVGAASVRGRVTDESGAGVPGVTVTVASPSLQLRERSAVSEVMASIKSAAFRSASMRSPSSSSASSDSCAKACSWAPASKRASTQS
jgi:hypothetical protein